MYSISAKDIIIYSKKGLYEEELLIENKFRIHVEVQLNDYFSPHYIDYETIVDSVKLAFEKEIYTLENLASFIIQDLKNKIKENHHTEVEIIKENPSIANIHVGSLRVKIRK